MASRVMIALSPPLVASLPVGPGADSLRGGLLLPEQLPQHTADLWPRQGNQRRGGPPCLCSCCRPTTQNAWANSASVMWRFQAGPFRTAYSSNPQLLVAVSNAASMGQRLPATCTTVSSAKPARRATTE